MLVLLLSLTLSATQQLEFTANPDTPNAVVSGVVTDRSGHPLSGAEVRLINPATGEVVSARSDANGSYLIKATDPSADYTVTVRRIGFAPEMRPGMRIGNGESSAMSFALDSLKVKFPASKAGAERKTK